MKTFLYFTSLLFAVLATGCRPAASTETVDDSKVEGETVIFATNAMQVGYLTLETAQERKAAAVGLYGRLAWDDDLTVRIYSPVAGRVISAPVEVNALVAKNDPLATLDSPDFGQALATARTAVGNFMAADKTLTREKELLSHGAAAQKDVEAAEAAYVAATAERDRAQATLANLGGSVASTNEIYALRAPLAGVVVEKNISPGQEIRSDLMLANAQQFINPLFVVTDPTRLWLFLDVTELDLTRLTPGSEIFIHTAAYPDKIFHGRLEMIGRELDPTTRTVKARCVVDNCANLLRAEMYVNVDVAASGPAGVDVPTKALFLKGEEHYVFVQTGPAQFTRRKVKLGLEGDSRTVVTAGLAPGERVVGEGCLLLETILEGAKP